MYYKHIFFLTFIFCLFSCSKDDTLEEVKSEQIRDKVRLKSSSSNYKFDYPTPDFILEKRNDLKWGINGHPLRPDYVDENGTLVDSPYNNISFKEQATLLDALHTEIYRFDIHVNDDGSLSSGEKEEDLNAVLSSLNANKMEALPMIYIRDNNYNLDNNISLDDLITKVNNRTIKELDLWTNNYSKFKQRGENFAKFYNNKIKYYQVGNEGAYRIISRTKHPLNNNPNKSNVDYFYEKIGFASKKSDFFTSKDLLRKAIALAAASQGLIDGIKKFDNDAEFVINDTRAHYGYLELFEHLGVNYDIVGWNWYNDMGLLTNTVNNNKIGLKGGTNVYSKLLEISNNKDIWLTEINRGRGSRGYDKKGLEMQSNSIYNSMQKMYKLDKVKAYLIYELFDYKLADKTDYFGLYNIYENDQLSGSKPSYNTYKYSIEELKYGYHDLMFSYYKLYTGRTLDIENNTDLDYWADLLKSGRGVEGMFYDLLKLDAKVFVSEAYKLYLDRSPDLTGVKYYVSKIQNENWSREKVISDICSSKEFWDRAQINNKISSNPSLNFKERVYRKIFNRGVPSLFIENNFNDRKKRRAYILSSSILESVEFKRNFIKEIFAKLLERDVIQKDINDIIAQWGSQNRRIVAILISNEFWRKAIIRGYQERKSNH